MWRFAHCRNSQEPLRLPLPRKRPKSIMPSTTTNSSNSQKWSDPPSGVEEFLIQGFPVPDDLLIKSRDGILFSVHKMPLAAVSSVLVGMFASSKSDDDDDAIPAPFDSGILRLFLKWCYRKPESAARKASTSELEQLHEVADFYGVPNLTAEIVELLDRRTTVSGDFPLPDEENSFWEAFYVTVRRGITEISDKLLDAIAGLDDAAAFDEVVTRVDALHPDHGPRAAFRLERVRRRDLESKLATERRTREDTERRALALQESIDSANRYIQYGRYSRSDDHDVSLPTAPRSSLISCLQIRVVTARLNGARIQ
ncbi:hypothetical protein DFJ74DRAFT_141220 [Hyaloraphidium curvatum]|nr:hypothetical protein DFJ74DRAFT_141220 [Hyaloraphidium curvatum]